MKLGLDLIEVRPPNATRRIVSTGQSAVQISRRADALSQGEVRARRTAASALQFN
jgi:hypothetical protein